MLACKPFLIAPSLSNQSDQRSPPQEFASSTLYAQLWSSIWSTLSTLGLWSLGRSARRKNTLFFASGTALGWAWVTTPFYIQPLVVVITKANIKTSRGRRLNTERFFERKLSRNIVSAWSLRSTFSTLRKNSLVCACDTSLGRVWVPTRGYS